MRPDESYSIRHRVRLPDGREVEMVYLDCNGTAHAEPEAAPPLHVCFHCGGRFVHPLEWGEEGCSTWRILLRCPECEATREGVFEKQEIDALEHELDAGIGSVISDLRRMTHANMSAEIDFFVKALHADVILPSDFQRPA